MESLHRIDIHRFALSRSFDRFVFTQLTLELTAEGSCRSYCSRLQALLAHWFLTSASRCTSSKQACLAQPPPKAPYSRPNLAPTPNNQHADLDRTLTIALPLPYTWLWRRYHTNRRPPHPLLHSRRWLPPQRDKNPPRLPSTRGRRSL